MIAANSQLQQTDWRAAARQHVGRKSNTDRNWALIFLSLVLAFDVGMFFFGNTALRLPFRMGGFALSLAALFFVGAPDSAKMASRLPAARWVSISIAILFISILNPDGNTLLSRLAIIFLYLAVLAPLIWTARLPMDQRMFRQIVLVLWAYYTLSAGVGILQVEFPDRFDGAMSENIEQSFVDAHSFTLANGQKIVRPKGLSDEPGGAGNAGMYTIILGTGLLLTEKKQLIRIVAAAAMIGGLFCIYLAEGRSTLIIVGVAELSMLALLVRRGIMGRAVLLLVIGVGVVAIGTTFAFAVGGETVVDRWSTMTAEDPTTVYQQNRGQFLSQLIYVDMWKYPFGAGQGRWGMMSFYFGNGQDGLWAEMQWQGLLYDGGIPLIIAYAGLLVSLLWTAYSIAGQTPSNDMACWAAVVFGYTLSAIVATFSFPYFCHDMGMQLLLLNGCLYGVFRSELSRTSLPMPVTPKSFRQARCRYVHYAPPNLPPVAY